MLRFRILNITRGGAHIRRSRALKTWSEEVSLAVLNFYRRSWQLRPVCRFADQQLDIVSARREHRNADTILANQLGKVAVLVRWPWRAQVRFVGWVRVCLWIRLIDDSGEVDAVNILQRGTLLRQSVFFTGRFLRGVSPRATGSVLGISGSTIWLGVFLCPWS